MEDQLWAPWRYNYITSSATELRSDECVLCGISRSESPRDDLMLLKVESCFVMLNAYPYTSGHLMVSPLRHVADLTSLTDQELVESTRLVSKAITWLKAVYSPHGFNVGLNLGSAAGAGIPGHLHWHIVPRWNGDTNFMTSVAGVRVIPQDLRLAYDLLAVEVQRD